MAKESVTASSTTPISPAPHRGPAFRGPGDMLAELPRPNIEPQQGLSPEFLWTDNGLPLPPPEKLQDGTFDRKIHGLPVPPGKGSLVSHPLWKVPLVNPYTLLDPQGNPPWCSIPIRLSQKRIVRRINAFEAAEHLSCNTQSGGDSVWRLADEEEIREALAAEEAYRKHHEAEKAKRQHRT